MRLHHRQVEIANGVLKQATAGVDVPVSSARHHRDFPPGPLEAASPRADEAKTSPWKRLLRRHAFVVATFLLASLFTSSQFTGDSMDYAASITTFEQGRIYEFWDFGHLLWRPLGWALFHYVYRPLSFGNQPASPFDVLVAINWLSALLCVFLLNEILSGLCRRAWVANLGCVALIFCHAFLNFHHSATPYIPGLCALLFAFYQLLACQRDGSSLAGSAMLAGLGLSLAMGFWFVYVGAALAVLLFPVIMFGNTPRQWRLALGTAVTAGLLTVVFNAAVILHLRLRTPVGIEQWILSASHGITNVRGTSRMIFGFARSWVDMGNDGVLFKRYLLRDPYSPVSTWQLLRASLWKFLAFYLSAAIVTLGLLRSAEGRRIAALLLLNAIPVFAFAWYWQGGDMERYLALCPVALMAVASFLALQNLAAAWKTVPAVFVVLMLLVNFGALSQTALERERQDVYKMVSGLRPHFKAQSRVVVTAHHPLRAFKRIRPLDPLNAQMDPFPLVEPGMKNVTEWPEEFASMAFSVWSRGGDVWLVTCLLGERPGTICNWVEGDDPRVSWHDIHRVLSRLELGEAVGGGSGFTLLLDSASNRAILQSYLKKPAAAR